MLHEDDRGHASLDECRPDHIPGHSHLSDEHESLHPQGTSKANSERSTNFDVSEHDFLSVRGPRSHRSTMETETAGGAGGVQRKKQVRRKLILCFDGTGNKFHGDESDSNILKIFRMLDRTANDQCEYFEHHRQVATDPLLTLGHKTTTTNVSRSSPSSYGPIAGMTDTPIAGIGTYVVSKSLSHTSLRSRLRSWYLKAKDSAVGSSFDEHVVGGYRFLMRFYCPGDEIYIFGFSRGAYIARCK